MDLSMEERQLRARALELSMQYFQLRKSDLAGTKDSGFPEYDAQVHIATTALRFLAFIDGSSPNGMFEQQKEETPALKSDLINPFDAAL